MSNEAKHTPGPWEAIPNSYGYEIKYAYKTQSATTMINIATVRNGPSKEFNARLIAAAPEMLEALELARGRIEEDCPQWIINMLDVAIAKAKGGTK